ncbi:MAG TPA: saccharopine dehydrogenase C-terminal domain-containing protein [Myxococcota bacterium]|jgi:lysine 6-dehydrogenase|nr:saccharopine dehydrogenase C-terminal domain-containing protein [Myxococcota bacterium]
MGVRYAVLGAGRQGTAAAFDLARVGGAEVVWLTDAAAGRAEAAAERVNRLAGADVARGRALDVSDERELRRFLSDVDSCVSAVPYFLNLAVARAAVQARTSLCDLGGNTAVVLQELQLHAEAEAAGVSVVPDCGLDPGLSQTLAAHGIARLDRAREVRVYCGGLPQKPRPPLGYALSFSMHGLLNEYAGHADFLRGGRRVQVPCLTEVEEVDFPPPLGRCEAFVTSGGTSTGPWTYEGKVDVYETKTLRYPGHCAVFRALADVGLLGEEPVTVGKDAVSPRALTARLLEPLLTDVAARDVVALRVLCRGERGGRPAEVQFDVLDFHDEATGFSAMERTTGWHAATVAAMMAHGEVPRGALPVERAVDPVRFLARWEHTGVRIDVKERGDS